MKKYSRILWVIAGTLVALPALAQDGAQMNEMANLVAVLKDNGGLIALGACLGIGLAAFGGAAGQGRAAASALEGIARNPAASGKLLVPLVLSLALIESLIIFSLLIALQVAGVLGDSFGPLIEAAKKVAGLE